MPVVCIPSSVSVTWRTFDTYETCGSCMLMIPFQDIRVFSDHNLATLLASGPGLAFVQRCSTERRALYQTLNPRIFIPRSSSDDTNVINIMSPYIIHNPSIVLLLPLFFRTWYCSKESFVSVYLSKLITGWVPSLLLLLWQNMVLPITMLLLAQVRCKTYDRPCALNSTIRQSLCPIGTTYSTFIYNAWIHMPGVKN